MRQLQIQAKELRAALAAGDPEAAARFQATLGRTSPGAAARLSEAQHLLAREYGCLNWAALGEKVAAALDASITEEQLERLRNIIRRGTPAQLHQILREHPALVPRINKPLFAFGSPPLREAVAQGNRAMVDALLDAGADINARSDWAPGSFGVLDNLANTNADSDETAEHKALVDYLIARGATVDIHAAAGNGKIDRVRELLDINPALANARGGDGAGPLHFAGTVEIAELLLERGACVAMRDLDHHSTAAMWQVKNKEILYRIIEAGSAIDIYMAARHGDRALADRALAEDPHCLDSTVGHQPGQGNYAPAEGSGGNIYNWTLGHGARPIPIADKFHHRELADYLLTRATPSQQIIALAIRGDKEAAQAVIAAHPDVFQHFTENDKLALPQAIHFGDTKAATLMIELGFPLDVPHLFDGGTPIHAAAWHGQAAIVRALAALRPQWLTNHANAHNSTPLGWACHGSLHSWFRDNGDYPATVQALLDTGIPLATLGAADVEDIVKWGAEPVTQLLRHHAATHPTNPPQAPLQTPATTP
ncbi:hypothetical protein DB346_07230 [Verrucomicrobia bacterium LW23]|nr:hypothetical protein DB346_07230 [Verrucomicrobia bacterium LW23]